MKHRRLWAALGTIALMGALCAGCGRQLDLEELRGGSEPLPTPEPMDEILAESNDELQEALEGIQQILDELEAAEAAGTDPAAEPDEGAGDGINTVLDIIESQTGFRDEWLEPLAAVSDFNGDGVRELLALYETEEGGGAVMYELWSLCRPEPELITDGTLYQEVGGNGGTVSIARVDDTAYLVLLRTEPAGDRFNNYYTFIPMEKDESAMGNGEMGMESHGTYGEGDQGEYIIGATQVSMEEFEAKLEEFSNRLFIMDIFMGPEDVGVMTFDDLRG